MDEPLVLIDDLTKRFGPGQRPAIERLSTRIEPGRVTGLVGPDGAGKTTLLRLIAGLLLPDEGRLTVCGFNTAADIGEIRRVVAYMPQRFGLYEDLTVLDNLTLYADLRAVVGRERQEAFERLLTFTDLARFSDRLAGALSGGMKQKLGLACALVRKPRLLLLDEPSVGVDPISRRELWQMVYTLVDQGIGVVWSTAYLDEAERCPEALLLSEGRLLYGGPPTELIHRAAGRTYAIREMEGDRRAILARALGRPEVMDGVIQGRSVRLLLAEGAEPPRPENVEAGAHAQVVPVPPRFEDAFMILLGGARANSPFAALARRNTVDGAVVEASVLTRRFGRFVAADRISFSVRSGEIFGLLGPNGAGKSTTFKMLCGLLRPSSGTAWVTGVDLATAPGLARARLGYMAQRFSLYADLSVQQNLDFFAGIYGLSVRAGREATARMVETFDLTPYLAASAGLLPLGFKQRLALACAVLHDPDVLFLDEPTSGVDPRTRREFWAHINAMVERGVTVMVTTHFMEEAEYCDRIGLVYRGQLIASGSPDELKVQARSATAADPTLEDAFIALIEAYDRKAAA